jgi:CheY-like chemotaxis protein
MPMPTRAAKILIAEDQALIALSLSQGLAFDGHLVCGVVATAEDGIALARIHRPDLALLDVHLARGSDGRDIAHVLRAELGIPSILLTAQVGREEARGMGVLGLVPKPYGIEDVLRAVEDAVAFVRTGRVPASGSPHLFLPTAATRPLREQVA